MDMMQIRRPTGRQRTEVSKQLIYYKLGGEKKEIEMILGIQCASLICRGLGRNEVTERETCLNGEGRKTMI